MWFTYSVYTCIFCFEVLTLLILLSLIPPPKKQHRPEAEEPGASFFACTNSTISFGQLGPGSGRVEGRGKPTGRDLLTSQQIQTKYPAWYWPVEAHAAVVRQPLLMLLFILKYSLRPHEHQCTIHNHLVGVVGPFCKRLRLRYFNRRSLQGSLEVADSELRHIYIYRVHVAYNRKVWSLGRS